MEEITTRFEIVRLAVKMADHETVLVQAKKLRELSLDEDLNDIIALLESKNYRQALFLMKDYVNFLDDSFFNKSSATTPSTKKYEAPKEAVGAQNLFDMMQPQTTKTINLDDMLRMTEDSAGESVSRQQTEHVAEAYIAETKEEARKNEAYLDTHKNRAENKTVKPFETSTEELLSDIDGNIVKQESVSEIPEVKESVSPSLSSGRQAKESLTEVEMKAEAVDAERQSTDDIQEAPEDFDEAVITSARAEIENFEVSTSQSDTVSLYMQEPRDISAAEEMRDTVDHTLTEAVSAERGETREEDSYGEPETEAPLPPVSPTDASQEYSVVSDPKENNSNAKEKENYTRENRRYSPISYIDQKFRNMRHQFPQIEEGKSGIIDEVKMLLRQVATEGYTENDIRDAIRFYQEKKAEGYRAEAAQMLLLAAASESKYAQLLLARELFRGEVLKIDYPESFTQINRLADHDYPEAICDLAQLYEYGYGIKKDKKTALLLYEEAAEMGIERAKKHVTRLSNKRGILGTFFR